MPSVSKDGNEYHLMRTSFGVYAYYHVKLLKELLGGKGVMNPAFNALSDNQARIMEKIFQFLCEQNKQETTLKRSLRFW